MPTDAEFDRTQILPGGSGPDNAVYVKDNNEWIARCLARVMALDAVLTLDEARPIVVELASRERWRVLAPEAAADQMYLKPKGPTAP